MNNAENSSVVFVIMIVWYLQAKNFLAPDELFKGEVAEVIDKVKKSCEVLDCFRKQYDEHKAKIATYFKDGREPREWEFASELVFARYDKFHERVVTVKVNTFFLSWDVLNINMQIFYMIPPVNDFLIIFIWKWNIWAAFDNNV